MQRKFAGRYGNGCPAGDPSKLHGEFSDLKVLKLQAAHHVSLQTAGDKVPLSPQISPDFFVEQDRNH